MINPKRTAKLTIIVRMCAIPMAACLGLASFFWLVNSWFAFVILMTGVGTFAAIILFCWAITNFGTFLFHPTYYRLWKKGGGDPWFDTLSEPFNMDDNATRFQELFRERERQELEQLLGPPLPPLDPSDRGIDDPNFL